MKLYSNDKESDPVKINICEGVMSEVVRGKKKKSTSFGLYFVTYDTNHLFCYHRENGKDMCLNIYDVRLYDVEPACGMNWPPDLSHMYTYLRVSKCASFVSVGLDQDGLLET